MHWVLHLWTQENAWIERALWPISIYLIFWTLIFPMSISQGVLRQLFPIGLTTVMQIYYLYNCWKDDKLGELFSGVEPPFSLRQLRFWLHPNHGREGAFNPHLNWPYEEFLKSQVEKNLPSSPLIEVWVIHSNLEAMKRQGQVRNLCPVQSENAGPLGQKARKSVVKIPKI